MQTRKHYFSVKLQLPAFVIKMWDKEKSSNSTMHCALLLSKVSSQILVIYRTGTIFREISSQLSLYWKNKRLSVFPWNQFHENLSFICLCHCAHTSTDISKRVFAALRPPRSSWHWPLKPQNNYKSSTKQLTEVEETLTLWVILSDHRRARDANRNHQKLHFRIFSQRPPRWWRETV